MNKEFLHMQKLAGIITEGEYKQKLNENEDWIDVEYPSGDYAGVINGDKVTFLLIDNDITDKYEEGFGALDDQSILDYLGANHFFTQLYNNTNAELDAADDEIGITVDLNDLKSKFGKYIIQ